MSDNGCDRQLDGIVVVVAQVPLSNPHCELAWQEAEKKDSEKSAFPGNVQPLLVLVLCAVSCCYDVPVTKIENGLRSFLKARSEFSVMRAVLDIIKHLSVMRAPPHQNSLRPPPWR